jgi:hypothetical protein
MIEKKELVWNASLNRWVEQLVFTTDSLGGVVYREGQASAGSVYSNFADAVNAINDAGAPAILYVDGSVGQPTVPAGVYDLSLVTLSEFPGRTLDSLNLQNGAKFRPAPSIISDGLSLYSFSSLPIIDQHNLHLTLKDSSWLQTAGSGPFIHVGNGATAQIFLENSSYLAGSLAGSTAPIVSADGYSVFTGINVGNWSDVGEGALDGYGTMEVNLLSPSSSIEAQHTCHALTVVLAALASAEAYEPSDDGYWSAIPKTVSEALDLLAEKTNGSSGSKDYSMFFALMPGDNSATVATGAAVLFPQDGPSSGVIVRTSASTFKLPAIGTYEITWQVSVDEPGQLQLAIGGSGLADTVVGRGTGTNQMFGNTFITTMVSNSILSVINPPGNPAALTITPIAGGTHSVSATLSIKML